MQNDLPLLIMADIPQTFCLTSLTLSDQASEIIRLTPSQHQNRDRLDAMIGGMTFILTRHSAENIHQDFPMADLEFIFYEPSEKKLSGIAISHGEHIASAKHSGTVNRALLQLAKHVGQAIEAASIIWRPAQLQIGFDYFIGATDHYISGGPFPVLAQIAISETTEGLFQTSGLSYFSEQEIRISAPPGYAPNEVVKRLVRIAHDIATNGKIDTKIETEGFVQGEKLSITPHKDREFVDVAIVAAHPRPLH